MPGRRLVLSCAFLKEAMRLAMEPSSGELSAQEREAYWRREKAQAGRALEAVDGTVQKHLMPGVHKLV